jgi:hypothetical protein
LYSLTVAGDAVQTTAASQPLLLVHSGANYWFGSGVAGNFVRTPNATANQIIGDFDIKVQISTKTLSGSETGLFTKYDGINNKAQYMLVLRGDGALRTYISSNGTSNSSFISTAAIANNWDGWVRVTRDSTVGTITYYTSLDGSNWTQLGATTNLFTGNLYNGNTDVEVGAYNAGVSGSNVSISVLRATISNSIGGAPVVDFNPNTYNASTSQTAWTSATGEIWTISTGTATTGYKGVLVDRTIVQGDGVDDSMTSGTLASANYFSSYIALNPKKFDASKYIIDGSSNDNHYIYNGSSVIKFGEIPYVGGAQNVLNLYSGDFNNTNTKIRLNNTNEQSGIFVTVPTTSVKLFSRSNGLLSSNTNINTLIFSASIDTDTTKTATYNLIRSLNNNSF